MTTIKTDLILDAKGLACPMPIVKTKKAINGLEPGQVLEVQATDKGSKADIKAWSESTGHQYIGTMEDGDVLKHYIRKASADEEKTANSYPNVISNDDLEKKLNTDIIVLDVRETADFAFGHIPNAKSIPLGELENRLSEINGENEINVVCRTGNRSDLAASKLAEKGFGKVFNVIPGMSGWNGPTTSN
jgi:TusA-related sulfurtransferase/rhodanese-related sulfurtransferase